MYWAPTLPPVVRLVLLLLAILVWATDSVSAQGWRVPLVTDVPSVQELARGAVAGDGRCPPRCARLENTGVRTMRTESPSSQLPGSDDSHRFRDALIGSTLGVGVGAGTLFLLSGSDLSDRNDQRRYADDERVRAQGAALLLVIGGAPIGAVLGAGLADNGLPGEALVAAGLGEVIFAGMGLLLGLGGAALMEGGSHAQQVGVGLGAGLGAAVGAALGATLSGRERDGALSFQQGAWSLGLPDITIQPTFRNEEPIVANVPLVTASF